MQRKYLTVNLTVDLSLKSRHLRLPLNLYLPGYLIHLTAELRLDGQIVANGGTFTMGDELVSNNALFDPARGWDFGEDNRPIAGEYIATHVDLQGVSTTQLQTMETRLSQTQTKLAKIQFAGLTKEDISGDMLYGAVLSYFAANQAAAQIALVLRA